MISSARPILKWSARLLGAAVVIGLIGLAAFTIASERVIDRQYPLPGSHVRASTDAASIARGARLVFAYGCADCHGPKLQGAYIPSFAIRSRNLTILARSLSDADFDRVIRHGLRPDGTAVAEFMPSDSYQFMADSDLAAILGYLRSQPAAGEDVPEPSFGLHDRYQFLSGARKTVRDWFPTQTQALDMGQRYERGRVMAMTACGECHTTSLKGQPGPPGSPPDLSLVASYDRATFLNFLRTGKAAGNRELPMMSAVARIRFSHLTDDDLNALYGYLAARGRKLTGG
jgi:mono/diheme cytochrome c family protein